MSDENEMVARATNQPTVKAGQEAWTRIKAHEPIHWEDWLKIGRALEIGRDFVEDQTKVTKGRTFNEAMGEWLKETGFDDIEKGARSTLKAILEEPEITSWRLSLPVETKLKLNHPKTVLAKWKTTIRKEVAEIRENVLPEKAKLAAAWAKFNKLASKADPALVTEVTGHDLGLGKAQPAIATAMQKKLSRVAAIEKPVEDKEIAARGAAGIQHLIQLQAMPNEDDEDAVEDAGGISTAEPIGIDAMAA